MQVGERRMSREERREQLRRMSWKEREAELKKITDEIAVLKQRAFKVAPWKNMASWQKDIYCGTCAISCICHFD